MAGTVAERVARGAAWLDEVDPDWRDFVSEELLEMSDGCNCVLGQLFAADDGEGPSGEGYGYGETYAYGKPGWAEEHGFIPAFDGSWEYLERVWIKEIRR